MVARQRPRPDQHRLSTDEDSDKKKEGASPRTDGDFGLSWIRARGQGRVFNQALGHHESIFYDNPRCSSTPRRRPVARLGDLKADDSPSGKGDRSKPVAKLTAPDNVGTDRQCIRQCIVQSAYASDGLSACAIYHLPFQQSRLPHCTVASGPDHSGGSHDASDPLPAGPAACPPHAAPQEAVERLRPPAAGRARRGRDDPHRARKRRQQQVVRVVAAQHARNHAPRASRADAASSTMR